MLWSLDSVEQNLKLPAEKPLLQKLFSFMTWNSRYDISLECKRMHSDKLIILEKTKD